MTRRSASERFLATECFLLGIGAQKSATSWLADGLAKTPDVHMFPWKEAHYWDAIALPDHNGVIEMLDERIRNGHSSLAARISTTLSIGRPARRMESLRLRRELALKGRPDFDGYRKLLMIGYRGQRVVSEYTPAYSMLDRSAFSWMNQVHPNTKFVFVMRDPVHRHISSVKHFLAEGRLLKLDGRETSDPEFRARCIALARDQASPIFRRGDYRRTIEELESVVDPERIFYGFYETLMDRSEMERLARFIGIPHIASNAGLRVNVAKLRFDSEGDEFVRSLADSFEDVYAFIRKRFGSEVPSAWQRQTRLVEHSA